MTRRPPAEESGLLNSLEIRVSLKIHGICKLQSNAVEETMLSPATLIDLISIYISLTVVNFTDF